MQMRKIIETWCTIALWVFWIAGSLIALQELLSASETGLLMRKQLLDMTLGPVFAFSILTIILTFIHFNSRKALAIQKKTIPSMHDTKWSQEDKAHATSGKLVDLHFYEAGLACRASTRVAEINTISNKMDRTVTHQSNINLPKSNSRRTKVLAHNKNKAKPWERAVMALLLCLYPSSSFAIVLSEQPIQMEISAPFTLLWQESRRENLDENPEKNKAPWREGQLLSTDNTVLPIKIRGRGNSSALSGEGDFPKLRIKIKKGFPAEQSPFARREFRINTHVSTNPQSLLTPIGRLNNENAPWREALAYELSRIVGFHTNEFKRAIIHYYDSETKQSFTRKALLLETDSDLENRLAARMIGAEEFSQEAKTGISSYDSAKIHMLQVLLGNDDFLLRVDNEAPNKQRADWDYSNVIVLEKNGKRFPLPYDFDLSTIVAGEIKLEEDTYRQDEFGFADDATGRLAMMIASIRARHPHADVEKAFFAIYDKRLQLEKAILNAAVDEEGRAIAMRHLQRFLTHAKAAIDLPLAQEPGIVFYKTPHGGYKLPPMPISHTSGALRVGTPIKILEHIPGFLKVAVIDFRNDLPEEEDNIGYIKDDTAIGLQPKEKYIGDLDERDIAANENETI